MWFKAMYTGKYHEFIAIRINKPYIASSDTNEHIHNCNGTYYDLHMLQYGRILLTHSTSFCLAFPASIQQGKTLKI